MIVIISEEKKRERSVTEKSLEKNTTVNSTVKTLDMLINKIVKGLFWTSG